MPATSHPERLVQEFHDNSKALAEAFLASPTAHLDSYPQLCWPADNVTALASLLQHDDLFGTQFRAAFDHWMTWTEQHSDPLTKLPAGHLSSRSGDLLQPARGCANSWIMALAPQMDASFARTMYHRYREHFLINRLGISMFREYPKKVSLPADVDSGPIVWSAGVTATGVGLAAALSNGDYRTADDIFGLATGLGLKRNLTHDNHQCTQYLLGFVPVGHAFLTWAHSLPIPDAPISSRRSVGAKLWARRPFIVLFFVYSLILFFCMRRLLRRS